MMPPRARRLQHLIIIIVVALLGKHVKRIGLWRLFGWLVEGISLNRLILVLFHRVGGCRVVLFGFDVVKVVLPLGAGNDGALGLALVLPVNSGEESVCSDFIVPRAMARVGH